MALIRPIPTVENTIINIDNLGRAFSAAEVQSEPVIFSFDNFKGNMTITAVNGDGGSVVANYIGARVYQDGVLVGSTTQTNQSVSVTSGNIVVKVYEISAFQTTTLYLTVASS